MFFERNIFTLENARS